MSTSPDSTPAPARTTAPPAAGTAETALRQTLLSRGYLRLLLLSALLGVPVALACFFFVALQHELQHWVWTSLPEALGHPAPPWWWPLPALLLAGLIVAPVVTRLPGRGGHLPVNGLGGPPVGPAALPGVVLAALLTLPLGVVLGPEAPLMAVGSGLALLALRLRKGTDDPQAAAVVANTGSTAAISTILGGPVVAAVLVVEAAGVGGARLVALLLPCLTASATGALVFTGFGSWTGLSIGALTLPSSALPRVGPDAGDFLWGLPLAALIAVVITLARRLGRRAAAWNGSAHGAPAAWRVVACAVAVGVCVAAYALVTGRSPAEAALSGQATLAQLAGRPHAWPVAALLALVLFKGLAWGISLGSLRGGPIFPSVLLGASAGIACSGLPGLGITPALALGIAAAATAVTGLPLTSSVLAVLLLGRAAYDQTPLIVLAAVVSVVVTQALGRTTGNGSGAHRP
ncbi:chloride channel protein [Streptomyces sp. NPDC056600]|uniref:chloride channel protein n=1 Tax=Streptomyces sp. NPDC056600 TaxID=3345874 RepID=UPI00369926A4